MRITGTFVGWSGATLIGTFISTPAKDNLPGLNQPMADPFQARELLERLLRAMWKEARKG